MKRIALAVVVALVAFTIGAVGRVQAMDASKASYLVVFDAPSDFVSEATRQSFTGIKVVRLPILGIEGYRVKVPSNLDIDSAIGALTARFPLATIEADSPIYLDGSPRSR